MRQIFGIDLPLFAALVLISPLVVYLAVGLFRENQKVRHAKKRIRNAALQAAVYRDHACAAQPLNLASAESARSSDPTQPFPLAPTFPLMPGLHGETLLMPTASYGHDATCSGGSTDAGCSSGTGGND